MATERRSIYQGRVIDLDVETVRLPNGNRAEIEVVRHRGAAAVVPLLPDGRVVLLKQYRHAGGGVLVEVPAGRLEPNEAPEVCAARELAEETGYRADEFVFLQSILTTPGFSNERIHLFLARGLRPGPPALEFDECIAPWIVPLPEALNAVTSGTIVDAKTIAALFAAGTFLGIVRWEGARGGARQVHRRREP